MTIEEVIKKAIEGGWKPDEFVSGSEYLHPNYWQSLGKAMGWNEPLENDWLIQWHHFIDHLAEGKTIEEFFKQF